MTRYHKFKQDNDRGHGLLRQDRPGSDGAIVLAVDLSDAMATALLKAFREEEDSVRTVTLNRDEVGHLRDTRDAVVREIAEAVADGGEEWATSLIADLRARLAVIERLLPGERPAS